LSYEIKWLDNRGVIVNYSGEIDAEEISKVQNSIIANPNSDNLGYIIYNFSSIDKLEINQNEIELIVAIDCAATFSLRRNINLALIENSQSAPFIAHYISSFRKYSDQWTIKSFNTIESAQAWVD